MHGSRYVDDLIRGLCGQPDKLTKLNVNRADVLDMDIDEAQAHLEWLDKTRTSEIEQAKKAAQQARAAARGGRS